MSAMVFSVEPEVPEGVAAHLALYGSAWLHSLRKVQLSEPWRKNLIYSRPLLW